MLTGLHLHQRRQPGGYAAQVVVGVHLDDPAIGIAPSQLRSLLADGARPDDQDVALQIIQVALLKTLAEDDGEAALTGVVVGQYLQDAFGVPLAALDAGPLPPLDDAHVGVEASQEGVGIARLEAAEVADDLDAAEVSLSQSPFRDQAQVLDLLDVVSRSPSRRPYPPPPCRGRR